MTQEAAMRYRCTECGDEWTDQHPEESGCTQEIDWRTRESFLTHDGCGGEVHVVEMVRSDFYEEEL
jgi:hypothetical protein